MDKAEFADLKSVTQGHFGGLGIVIAIPIAGCISVSMRHWREYRDIERLLQMANSDPSLAANAVRGAEAADERERLGQQAVARRRVVEEHEVAALLAAEREVAERLVHRLVDLGRVQKRIELRRESAAAVIREPDASLDPATAGTLGFLWSAVAQATPRVRIGTYEELLTDHGDLPIADGFPAVAIP